MAILPTARAGRVSLPVAARKNGPSAAALTIPGVGWGLPAPVSRSRRDHSEEVFYCARPKQYSQPRVRR